jgi:hypothetical protein
VARLHPPQAGATGGVATAHCGFRNGNRFGRHALTSWRDPPTPEARSWEAAQPCCASDSASRGQRQRQRRHGGAARGSAAGGGGAHESAGDSGDAHLCCFDGTIAAPEWHVRVRGLLCAAPSKPWYWAFQVQAPNSSWVGVPAHVHRNTVLLSSPVAISGVQYAWGGAPDCALYNGKGGFDNHTGIAAPPFRRCLWGTVAGLPPWNWLSDCNLSPQSQLEPNTMYGDAMVVPSASLQDFIVSSMHVVTVTPDGRSSGTALRSALNNDQGGATFTSRYAIGCRGVYGCRARPRHYHLSCWLVRLGLGLIS